MTPQTRQSRYQARHKAQGLCAFCSRKAVHGVRCGYHYWLNQMKKRKPAS